MAMQIFPTFPMKMKREIEVILSIDSSNLTGQIEYINIEYSKDESQFFIEYIFIEYTYKKHANKSIPPKQWLQKMLYQKNRTNNAIQ